MKFLKPVFENLIETLKDFRYAIDSPVHFEGLLLKYGYNIEIDNASWSKLNQVSNLLIDLNGLIDQLETISGQDFDLDPGLLSQIIDIAGKVKGLTSRIFDLTETGLTLHPLDSATFWKDLGGHILNDIFIHALQRNYPWTYSILLFIGVIEHEEMLTGANGKVDYTKNRIHWDRIFDSSRLGLDYYHFGSELEDAVFLWDKLFDNLIRIFDALLLESRQFRFDGLEIEEIKLYGEYLLDNPVHGIQIPYFHSGSAIAEEFYNFGFGLMPVNVKEPQKPPNGLLIMPIIQGAIDQVVQLTDGIELHFATDYDAGQLSYIKVFPGEVELGGDIGSADLGTKISLVGNPKSPWYIFGTKASHHLSLSGFTGSLAIDKNAEQQQATISFKTGTKESNTQGIKIAILLEEADSFVKDATQQERIEAGLDLEIEWSNKTGFRFGGSAALDFKFRLNKHLGPIQLTNIYLEIVSKDSPPGRSKDSVQFRTGLGIQGDIGPVKFQIDNIGMSMDVIPYTTEEAAALAEPPILGLLDLDLGFAPPKGLGFVLDTKAVKGGGFLRFEDGEYLGYLELRIVDKFTVKAVGIVTTELPDGQDGYSFLLLILTEFKPIQLGMGFTLNGVGGIIGLHRDLNVDNIIAGMDDDTYKHLLFPEKPEDNIDDIISSLNAIMPIRRNQYAFGIMAEIGWGTNDFLEVQAGLLFSLPDFAIAIIGIAKAEIKRKGKTLVRLLFKFNATYDDALFTFDGSLDGSKLLLWDIVGGFAVRIRGGNDPFFLVSAGGFHPSYRPPEGLKMRKKMDRLRITFLDGNPHVYAECYFAITSNTLQFGGKGYGTYRKWGFGFDAELGFNALIQFNPLYFEASAYGRVELYAFGSKFLGVSLGGTVTGPYPLQFDLHVTVTVWIFSVTVHVTLGPIGKSAETGLEGVPVLPILLEQLEDDRNWRPTIPKGVQINVSLRKYEEEVPVGETPPKPLTKFHPVGSLTILQNQVPLNLELDKFGHRPPADYQRFELKVKGKQTRNVREFFAPVQFLDIPKEEQFKRKNYEKLDAGIKIYGTDDYVSGRLVEKKVEYEQHYIDDEYISEPIKEAMDGSVFDRLLGQSTVARSARGQAFSREDTGPRQRFKLQETLYAVKSTDAITAFGPAYQNIGSESEAYRLKRILMDRYPEKINDFEVVPMYELDALPI